MARRIRALDIWMNGLFVGQWQRGQGGSDKLAYSAQWMHSREGRPLSMSLPFARGHDAGNPVAIRGDVVAAYFENLIPDNVRILQRMRNHYGADSTQAFDLLAAVGRDCAGAVQLVPAGQEPGEVRTINHRPLDAAGVAQLLRDITVRGPWSATEADAFRLSIAGAQEKTALLRHKGKWCIPLDATPSTHIFKLPPGQVGNIRADMRDSVEIEWLCMELARELGLPVARTEIGLFEDQKVLIVERFDRRLTRDGTWWLRLPQEDFCQTLGLPPSKKYQADGGPGIRKIMDRLRASDHAEQDRRIFFTAQLMFWLMAATDGHAKNFSIQLRAGGGYGLSPLYDILSTYPIQGRGPNRLDSHKARLAMAVEGKNRHYLLNTIHRWHWITMAASMGLQDATYLVDAFLERVPKTIENVANRLPEKFPAHVFDSISQGVQNASVRLQREPDKRQK